MAGACCGERGEVVLVALEAGRLQHVVDEARLDAVDRGHPHVGRRPAGVAAGVGLGRLVEHGDRCTGVGRRFGRGERGGQPGRALPDDDDAARAHDACMPAR